MRLPPFRRLWLFDAGHLIGVLGPAGPYRHVFADHEAFLAEPEAHLVVALALCIVEIPLAAGLAPETTDAIGASRAELADAARRLMRFPFRRQEPPIRVERGQ